MMNREEAEKLAREYLDATWAGKADVEIRPDVREEDCGWVFRYGPTKEWRDRNPRYVLLGCCPLLITPCGDIVPLPVQCSIEQSLQRYRAGLPMFPNAEAQLARLLSNGPEYVKPLLPRIQDRFYLLGLAEGAAHRARQELSLEWAAIATQAYETFQSKTNEVTSAPEKAMRLRAWFICRLGPSPHNRVLDIDVILRWFRDSQRFSMEEVLHKISEWHQPGRPLAERLPLNDVKELLYLKSRLSVIKLLADGGFLDSEPELQQWLKLQERLP